MASAQSPLGEIATIIMGTSPKGNSYNNSGEGLPLLNGPTEFGQSHPECTLFTTDSIRECEPGDLIFCVRGSTTGRMNWADRKYSLGRGVCAFRGQTEKDTKFIRYCIELKLNELLQRSGGSTMPNLTQDTIRAFEIPFPGNRHRIADLISPYDDLIENNTRRIRILEEMARQIYREWFVEFRAPGVRLRKATPQEQTLTGKDRFPEGWEIRPLCDVVLNFDSKRKPISSMKRKEMQGRYPYYGAAKVLDYVNDYIFDGKYLLLAEDGSVATKDMKPVLQIVDCKFWPNNHTHILQGKDPCSTDFLYLSLLDLNVAGYITGAAQPKITQENMNRMPVVVSDAETLARFKPLAEQYIDVILIKNRININLQKTRDLLLPYLISDRAGLPNAV